MDMDAFKRCYSNKDTLTVSVPYFWEHFDKEHYSIWMCEYKYPEELKKSFMTCNLIGGKKYVENSFLLRSAKRKRKTNLCCCGVFSVECSQTLFLLFIWTVMNLFHLIPKAFEQFLNILYPLPFLPETGTISISIIVDIEYKVQVADGIWGMVCRGNNNAVYFSREAGTWSAKF